MISIQLFINISFVFATTRKSANLFVNCLLIFFGSGKPLLPNKRKQFTPYQRELLQLTLGRNLPDFKKMRIRAKSSNHFYFFNSFLFSLLFLYCYLLFIYLSMQIRM